jgi:hypothetical protein
LHEGSTEGVLCAVGGAAEWEVGSGVGEDWILEGVSEVDWVWKGIL